MQLPFFVYGTLRPGERNHHLIAAWVREVQPAEMAGLQLWDLGPYPMVCEGIGRVRGELLTIDPLHYQEAMARLDELEGVNPQAPTKPGGLYWRARRTAILRGCAAPLPEAWVYLGERSVAHQGTRIPLGEWGEARGKDGSLPD